MNIISGKADIKILLDEVISSNIPKKPEVFLCSLHEKILNRKVKFPVLEYAAKLLHELIPPGDQIPFLDSVISLDKIGSYVLAGKMLQFRLPDHFKESISKACEYYTQGDKWYACDIISERVMGHSLLTEPEITIPLLKNMALDDNKWIVRSVGVAAHYAAKKGLGKNYCEKVFTILLNSSVTTDFHTKKGIGLGAKTIARFHPDIIAKYYDRIYNEPEVKQWFKTKIKIGLSYAKRNSCKNNSE